MIHANDTGKGRSQNAGVRRKKKAALTAALMAMTLGLCATAPAARVEAGETTEAQSTQATETRLADSGQRAAGTALSSRGSLVYRGDGAGAQIYAADFLLLWDKLDTIPDTVFEPACYTHTMYCESGGYQGEREETHTLFFEAVDETCHRSRCRLDGTEFCPGYEPVAEEHYAYCYEPCEDGCHHVKICIDCGYRSEEECCFDLPGADPEEDERRCLCGNVKRPDDGSDVGEPPSGSDDGDESGDEPPDTESENESEDDSAGTESGNGSEDDSTGAESGNGSEDDTSGTETGEEQSETETGEDAPGAELEEREEL